MKRNYFLDGLMGVFTGDALGCPVQFSTRDEIRNRAKGPVTDMEGYGSFNVPAGSWTDDSSMTLALLASIIDCGGIVPDDIMERFQYWLNEGMYTPYGYAYDIGNTCMQAIEKYSREGSWHTCGRTDDHANGNGALMRILPVCLLYITANGDDDAAIEAVHAVASLTHNHMRSNMACGIYYFMARQIILNRENDTGLTLNQCLQKGLTDGRMYYSIYPGTETEMHFFDRVWNLAEFAELPEDKIRSTGYVMDSFEAALWSLANTDTFPDALLRAVNLGWDTDTVAAIAGGLAGLYYGFESIPDHWVRSLARVEMLTDACERADRKVREVYGTED